jgi:hypothetical protein
MLNANNADVIGPIIMPDGSIDPTTLPDGYMLVGNHITLISDYEQRLRNIENARPFMSALYASFGSCDERGILYPDSFAGFYFDDEGNGVILEVVNPLIPSLRSFADEWVFTSDNVTVRQVTYSYNELIEFNKKTVDRILGLNAADCYESNVILNNWALVATDVIRNRVVVELYDVSDDIVNLFKEIVLDAPWLVIELNELGPVPIRQYTPDADDFYN